MDDRVDIEDMQGIKDREEMAKEEKKDICVT